MQLVTKSPNKIQNKSGKTRRSSAKKLLIGSIYGRGAGSIAEQIGCPVEEGKELLTNFFAGFPRLKTWMDETREQTSHTGYVDDPFGRRRHLPNATLEPILIRSKVASPNPFLECDDYYVEPIIKEQWVKKVEKTFKAEDKKKLSKEAEEAGISIIDNRGKIAEAFREAPNWCCQAQTASWIKLNMLAIDRDEEIKRLGGKLLMTIHDEVQLEVPVENAEACKERLEYLMSNTVLPFTKGVPMPSDGIIEWSGHWYMSEIEALINDHFSKYTTGDNPISKEEAYNRICEEESELDPQNIYNFLFKGEYLR